MDPHLFVSLPPDHLYPYHATSTALPQPPPPHLFQQQPHHPPPSLPSSNFYSFDAFEPTIPPPTASFWTPSQGLSSASSYGAPEVYVPSYNPASQPPPSFYGWTTSGPYQERWIQSYPPTLESNYASGTTMPAPKQWSKKKKKKFNSIQPSTVPTTLVEVNTAGSVTPQGILFHKLATAENDAEKGPGWCSLCQILCTSDKVLKRHLIGKKHRRKLELHKSAIEVTGPTANTKMLSEVTSTQPAAVSGKIKKHKKQLEMHNTAIEVSGLTANTEMFTGRNLTQPAEDNEKTRLVVPMPDTERTFGVTVPVAVKEKPIGVTAKDVFEQMWLEISVKGKGRKRVISGADAETGGANTDVVGNTATALLSGDGKKRARGEMEMEACPEQDHLRCKLCSVQCNTREMLEIHFGGKKHAARLRKSQN